MLDHDTVAEQTEGSPEPSIQEKYFIQCLQRVKGVCDDKDFNIVVERTLDILD
ncbi:MAG: hypothetical protein R6U61_03420 [Thermoplasmata archaeon]